MKKKLTKDEKIMLNDYMLFVGNNLMKKREKMNLTQEELAELAGVEIKSVGDVERGQRYPGGYNMIKIVKALKCRPQDIMGDEPEVIEGAKESNKSESGNEMEILRKDFAGVTNKFIMEAPNKEVEEIRRKVLREYFKDLSISL